MTTITREQVQKIIDAADEVITALAGTNDDVHPDNSTKMTQLYDDLNDHYAPPEVVRELARIALASLEENEFIPKNLDRALGVVGVALPESKEEFNFQTERWIQRLIDRVIRYADEFKEQPAPVVPPAIEPDYKVIQARVKQPSNAEQVADLYALCWKPGDVVTYTPDPEKATIWLNNYSGTCVQEYVNLERLQEDTKHGLLEVAIARFSKMNEGFPIKRFKADWVISWMLENFPPIAQKQGDN